MASTSSLFEVVENVEVTKVVVTSPPPLTPVTPASGKSGTFQILISVLHFQ